MVAPSGVGVACLPCRLAPLFDKGDGEGGGANDEERFGYARRMVGEGGLLAADWLWRDVMRSAECDEGDGWLLGAVSRGGYSDEMMRNGGTEEVSCFRCPHDFPFSFLSYSFLLPRPTPSHRLFSACLLESVPRPRAWDVWADDWSAAAGGTAVCLIPIMSCRSLAVARSLLRFGSSCGAVPIAPSVRCALAA